MEKVKMVVNPIPKNTVLQQLWIGTATISEYQQVTDPITYQTTSELVPVVENEPCRLSYSRELVTDVTDGIPQVTQTVTLFIRPDIEIKDGSQITVTQHGRTNTFIRSSEPSVYTNHQEVALQLDKEV